jgi:hypothetical protein
MGKVLSYVHNITNAQKHALQCITLHREDTFLSIWKCA